MGLFWRHREKYENSPHHCGRHARSRPSLVRASREDVADVVMTFKSNSSRWMGERHRDFGWQAGYGAFSVSPSQIGIVKKYIANQAAHHKKRDFKEEFLIMLKKAGVDYDPRYIFD